MRILFTGTSSFTGAWFVNALITRGHDVVAVTRRRRGDYNTLRQARIDRLTPGARVVWECPTGSAAFDRLIDESAPFDLLCLHGAEVGDYRRADFDYHAALGANTAGLSSTLSRLVQKSCAHIVLTGTVFEAGEGAGDPPLRAFSPYGLSKALTSLVVEHGCQAAGATFAKFVIPNPFGPLEEPRFLKYLVCSWLDGEVPEVRTPAYVRDNIPVSLLAGCYVSFAEDVLRGRARRLHPAGYVESQGAFAQRVAAALAPHLGVPCPVRLARQTQFEEPRMRVNTQPGTMFVSEWDEGAAWQALAEFYRDVHRGAF